MRSQQAETKQGGQAMIEFIVGLVALLIAAVAVLTIALIAHEDTKAYEEAQDEAAEESMKSGFASEFKPISDVKLGADERLFTSDDEEKRGSLGGIRNHIAAEAYADGHFGNVLRPNGDTPHRGKALEKLVNSGDTDVFSVKSGDGNGSVVLPPAAKKLFGTSEASFEHTIYMPATGDLY